MQKLLKFASSPSNNRRRADLGQNGTNRISKSVDIAESYIGSPSTILDKKVETLKLSIPQESLMKNPHDGAISPPPPSPHPSAGGSSCESSMVASPPLTSPGIPDVSPPPASQSSPITTPTRSRRLAFFSSSRFASLDECNSTSRFGVRINTSADGAQAPASANRSPQISAQHQRRTAVNLPASPIRLLGPKLVSGVCGSGQSGNKSVPDFGDLEYMNSSNEGYRLTVEQCELVRQAWRACNSEPDRESAGAWIFKRIFAHHPYLKRLFSLHEVDDDRLLDANPQFQKHALVFTDVLEMVVDSVEALDDSMGPLLLSYGSKHVRFESGHGFQPQYWDIFAVAMTEYATNNWKFFKNYHRKVEALRAWRILVFFIVSKVKQGFMLEKTAEEKQKLGSSGSV